MKRILYMAFIAGSSLGFTNCATICGGSNYYAQVVVNNKPDARIYYKGNMQGTGNAIIAVPRKDAGRFSFTLQSNGCSEQSYRFKSRAFRGWALAGSLITWSYLGPIVDLATGAYWKPNDYEKGVSKIDFKNFRYNVDYTASCKADTKETPGPVEKKATTTDILYLKNGNTIRGTIIENIPGDRVQVRNIDGDIVLYPASEIDRIAKESKAE